MIVPLFLRTIFPGILILLEKSAKITRKLSVSNTYPCVFVSFKSNQKKVWLDPGKRLFNVRSTAKEYRKRNARGAVYDDPRVAVGSGVLTELQRERKRSQNARPSDTASSHLRRLKAKSEAEADVLCLEPQQDERGQPKALTAT